MISLLRCILQKGVSTLLGTNSQPFLHYFSSNYYILSLFFSLPFILPLFSLLPVLPLSLVISPPFILEIEWVFYPFCFSFDFLSPMFAYSCWLSFSLFWITQQKNSLVFFFFGGFMVKTWFLSSVNGGRPLMLFGLTCTS